MQEARFRAKATKRNELTWVLCASHVAVKGDSAHPPVKLYTLYGSRSATHSAFLVDNPSRQPEESTVESRGTLGRPR